MGAEFAAEFPKIAGRLDLGSTEVADPYVERLLEGFAFLTARIQLKMEAEFPTFTQSLLQMVYPHYLAPTPSMAVVQFTPGRRRCAACRRASMLPRGTELRSLLGTEDQTNCEFRTGHPVHLLPIEIGEAEYIASPAAVAALGCPSSAASRRRSGCGCARPASCRSTRSRWSASACFSAARKARGCASTSSSSPMSPRSTCAPPRARCPGRTRCRRAPSKRVGFERGRGAAAARAAIVRRLPAAAGILRDAGALPVRRYSTGWTARRSAAPATSSTSSCCSTRSEPRSPSGFGPDHLQLFCTPAINLFPKPQRPHQPLRARGRAPDRAGPHAPARFRGVQRAVRWRALPPTAARRSRSCRSTPPTTSAGTRATAATTCCAASRGSFPRARASAGRGRAISATRCSSRWSIADTRAAAAHDLRQLGLDLLCTNRDLPLSMPVGKQHTDFTIAVSAPVASIRCLVGPTAPRPCRGDGDYAWRFISHLGLNYLSLADTDATAGRRGAARVAAPLRALDATRSPARQLEGLLSVASPAGRAPHSRAPGRSPPGAGCEITLTIDEARVRRRRRHPARRRARPVLRQIRLDQRLHRDGAAQPRAGRGDAMADAARPAADPVARHRRPPSSGSDAARSGRRRRHTPIRGGEPRGDLLARLAARPYGARLLPGDAPAGGAAPRPAPLRPQRAPGAGRRPAGQEPSVDLRAGHAAPSCEPGRRTSRPRRGCWCISSACSAPTARCRCI